MDINLIDIAIVGVIALSVLYGLYSGLIGSLVNLGGLVVSTVAAYLYYGDLSKWLVDNTQLVSRLVHYTEGSSVIGSLEIARTAVSTVGAELASGIVGKASFPWPFSTMVYDNILSRAFAAQGLTTVADYFDYTLAYATLNIISFLLILALVYVLFCIVGGIVRYVMQFPVLRQCDALLGGGFGLVRGVLMVFFIFMLLPIVLAVVPMDMVTEMVDASKLAGFFYDGNFILAAIKSVL